MRLPGSPPEPIHRSAWDHFAISPFPCVSLSTKDTIHAEERSAPKPQIMGTFSVLIKGPIEWSRRSLSLACQSVWLKSFRTVQVIGMPEDSRVFRSLKAIVFGFLYMLPRQTKFPFCTKRSSFLASYQRSPDLKPSKEPTSLKQQCYRNIGWLLTSPC